MGYSGLRSGSAIEGGEPYGELEAGIGMKSCKHALDRGGVLSTFFLRRWYPARVAGSHPRKSASIAAKVTAIEKRADQYQVVVQISPKHRGSFNTLAFGEVKPHSGSLQHGGLTCSTIETPALASEIRFSLWTLH
jgi:hypothetical protein